MESDRQRNWGYDRTEVHVLMCQTCTTVVFAAEALPQWKLCLLALRGLFNR